MAFGKDDFLIAMVLQGPGGGVFMSRPISLEVFVIVRAHRAPARTGLGQPAIA
jgi:hypothetical protein